MLLTVSALQHAFDGVPYDLVFLDRELHPAPSAGTH